MKFIVQEFGSAILIVSSALHIIAQVMGWKRYSLLTIFFPESNISTPWKIINTIGALMVFAMGTLLFAHFVNS